MKKVAFDFDVMLKQFRMMRRMEPIQKLLSMIPGLSAQIPSEAFESDFGRAEAIILSMTQEERRSPEIIDGSRRRRIAKGSGATEFQVSDLILRVYEMRRNMGSHR